MKKAFDQTVRDLKREVNKKVLKVPGIEQKVLDATCNEPWGPHGSHLADIAQATRNFHEYQMIMSVLWKRVNDTGKNWRHVYKGLIVLEYLVAHGSERVIDEIREHAYQISTLSEFQYIDSSGRDQGSNVRKKSQSLVALVSDKERIQEVRQKAYANKDKFHTSAGGMHKSSSYSSMGGGYGDRYDDDQYGSHHGNRGDGYGRDRDDDRYGTGGDSYSREGDRYNRQSSEERYGREGYRDDDYETASRHRNSDADRNRPSEEEDHYSSRSGRGRRGDYSPDERRLEKKLSSHHSAPPSYEEAVADVQPHARDQRDEGSVRDSVHKVSSPIRSTIQGQNPTVTSVTAAAAAALVSKEVSEFDEFDPRGAFSAAPTSTAYTEKGFVAPVWGLTSDALALVPVSFSDATSDADPFAAPGLGTPFETGSTAPTALSQASNDPFGDCPFKAMPSQDSVNSHFHSSAPSVVLPGTVGEGSGAPHPPQANKVVSIDDFGFGESFQTITYTPSPVQIQTNLDFQPSEQPIQPPPSTQPPPEPYLEPVTSLQQPPPPFLQPHPYTHSLLQVPSQPFMPPNVPQSQPHLQQSQPPQSYLQSQPQLQPQQGGASLPNFLPQYVPTVALASHPSGSMDATSKSQTQKDKFEPKSAVWADLSPGLVNLNISGSKINPLADIGIDFDSINRVEKRKEKEREKSAASSTTAMGKAMGAGSGVGRAGATGLTLPPRPIIGSGVGMGVGMGMGNGVGAAMGGYGFGMNQQPMGMGMGAVAGSQVRPGVGMPPSGPGMGAYNPAMGMGGYAPQNPYGGYR